MQIPSATKLLIIDQDVLGENFLTQSLIPVGYQVVKVNSSMDGIQTTKTWNPNVIIINIMQPAAKWLEVVLQNSGVQSGTYRPRSRLRSKLNRPLVDAGADDYLAKPFSSDILYAHLQKLTRRSHFKQNQTSLAVI
jgi:DNA-binding response OmpR family regulator